VRNSGIFSVKAFSTFTLHDPFRDSAEGTAMDQKIVLAALLATSVPLMTGCMPDSPRTNLDWGVNTTVTHHVAAKQDAKTYVYEENQEKDERPTPRPAPNYVTRNVTPYTPVTSEPLAPVAQAGAPAFAWPVNGRLISDFGATENGGKNDGINIATAMDAPIHASASGTVTYAGNELKNYGNLVLVKHAGGYTTAYAHADKLAVSRGDFVARGQVIGYVGQTGDVSTPQLHFEIRQQTTPVNPRAYLSSTTASN
jgi:murein DD-endopeptidase MepM/ murein hydrolase activator NlpD